MNDEARLLFSIWESISEFIAPNDRREAAKTIILNLIEHNSSELRLLHDAEGECPHLDDALEEVFQEIEEDSEDVFDSYED